MQQTFDFRFVIFFFFPAWLIANFDVLFHEKYGGRHFCFWYVLVRVDFYVHFCLNFDCPLLIS